MSSTTPRARGYCTGNTLKKTKDRAEQKARSFSISNTRSLKQQGTPYCISCRVGREGDSGVASSSTTRNVACHRDPFPDWERRSTFMNR